ncbi:MAG: S8 family serine peptidase [Epsilonproteobacteria bacterium]|nr:S8 family serine peptidase [Campylobacterota bacterium]
MKSKILLSVTCVLTLFLYSGCGSSSSPEEAHETINTTPSDETDNIDDTPDTNQTNPEINTTTPITLQNEPYYKYAWHLNKAHVLNTQGYTIDAKADINITAAWNSTKGSGIKVAVIDDSFDVNHEDLKANIAVVYNADTQTSDVSYDGVESSHGNTCAGFIVSPLNGKGIVGVAPEAKLIGIKQEISSDVNVIRAFEYAKNQGAKVISCSWGTDNVSQAVEDQLKSLYDANITVLFASGNDGKSLDTPNVNDESEVQWVIGVGASGENNDVTSYSNYGQNIELIAPGGDTQLSIGLIGIDDTGAQGASNQQSLVNNNYTFTDGTSFATPVAAGVVALMYAVNPNITPAQVKEILTTTADKVGGANAVYNNGFDEKRAYGKINAGKAVAAAGNL